MTDRTHAPRRYALLSRFLGGFALVVAASVFLTSCCENSPVENPTSTTTYRIVDGACGDVVFDEKVGVDYASAFSMIEQQKIDLFRSGCPDQPCKNIRVESEEITVVDAQGQSPSARFYALHVLDRESGTHLEGVSTVISTEGDLFHIDWCRD